MTLKLFQMKQRSQVIIYPLSPFFGYLLYLRKKNNLGQGNCFRQFLRRDAAVSCQKSTLLAAGRISALVLKAESGGISQYPLQLGDMTI